MIDPEILITGGIGLLTTVTGSWASWFFARKKYNAEVANDIIDGMKESLEFYIKLSDDNKEKLHEALEENKELRSQVTKVLEENEQLKRELNELKTTILKLTTSICTDLTCQIRQKEGFSTLDLVPAPVKVKEDEEVCPK